MSTLAVGVLKSNTTTTPVVQNTSGVEVGQFTRAWINFNGSGTVAIRSSFNIASITDNGVGDFTLNFINAMPTANYASIVTAHGPSDTFAPSGTHTYSTASARIMVGSGLSGYMTQSWGVYKSDPAFINVAIFI